MKKYNVRWVHPVTLVCEVSMEVIASSDEAAIIEADRLARSLQLTKCPRTIFEQGYLGEHRRLVARP